MKVVDHPNILSLQIVATVQIDGAHKLVLEGETDLSLANLDADSDEKEICRSSGGFGNQTTQR
jgi:hypothetical protein